MTTVEYTVGSDVNDGYGLNTNWYSTGNIILGRTSYRYYDYILWNGVTIPPGSTIDVAYISLYYVSTSGALGACTIQVEHEQNPSVVTNITDYSARNKCAATASWTPTTNAGWNNTSSIKAIIQELIEAHTLSSSNLQAFIYGPASPDGEVVYESYDTGHAPILHIEYTESTGNPNYAYTQMM